MTLVASDELFAPTNGTPVQCFVPGPSSTCQPYSDGKKRICILATVWCRMNNVQTRGRRPTTVFRTTCVNTDYPLLL